jgi:hypothetical protein
MQIKSTRKKYIYYVYIVRVKKMTKWVFHPMVILWSSYGDPMVRVGFGRYQGWIWVRQKWQGSGSEEKNYGEKTRVRLRMSKKSCTFAAVFNLRYSARTCIYMDFEPPTLLHSGVGGR